MSTPKKFELKGVNALGEPVKLSADVVKFTDDKAYFSISDVTDKSLKLTTPKGTYFLKKHAQLNIYQGEFNGHKVQVSLKKIVGWIQYW